MPHEGIWCDGGSCDFVLSASGVMGEATVVCLRGISCDGGSFSCVPLGHLM